jgi:hypothetical protein
MRPRDAGPTGRAAAAPASPQAAEKPNGIGAFGAPGPAAADPDRTGYRGPCRTGLGRARPSPAADRHRSGEWTRKKEGRPQPLHCGRPAPVTPNSKAGNSAGPRLGATARPVESLEEDRVVEPREQLLLLVVELRRDHELGTQGRLGFVDREADMHSRLEQRPRR